MNREVSMVFNSRKLETPHLQSLRPPCNYLFIYLSCLRTFLYTIRISKLFHLIFQISYFFILKFSYKFYKEKKESKIFEDQGKMLDSKEEKKESKIFEDQEKEFDSSFKEKIR